MSDTTIAEPSEEQFLTELAQVQAEAETIPSGQNQPDAQVEDATQDAETGDGQSPDEAEPAEDGTESVEESEPEKVTEKQPEKPTSKEEKEAARREKSWKKLQEEREAFQKEREALEAERAELAMKAIKKPDTLRDDKGFTAEDYERYADQIEKEGDHPQSTIELARLKARQLRDKEQFQATEADRQARELIVKETVKKYPELEKPESPIAKQMQALWQTEQKEKFFVSRPEGFAKLVEYADARAKADSVPSLEKKITELTKEVARLTKASTPSKAGLTTLTKKSGELTEDDVMAHMAEIDANGGFRR
jgi:hypothetical protein